MAKIVRNKPATPPTAEAAEAIAAFGAAAEARPTDPPAPEPSVSPAGPALSSRKKDKPKAPPKSSLIRWDGHEDLRDAILEYSNRERYPIHTVLLEAIRRGFEQIRS